MNWLEIAPGIFSVRERSHRFGQPATNVIYMPDGKGGGLLYDAGYAMPRSFNDFMSGFRNLAAHLKQTRRIPKDAKFSGLITTIIISHEHHDHASGVPILCHYFPHARVIASRPTSILLRSQRGFRTRPGELLEHLIMRVFYRVVNAQQSIKIDQVVSDGENITCGNRAFSTFLAPGHSPGQLLLIEPASGIMLGSDLVLQNGSTWLGPPHSNYQHYQDSMNRIVQLNPTLIIPAHGGPIRHPRDRLLELLTFRKLREEQIIKTCKNTPLTAGDIAWRIYRERGIGTYLIAKGMVELVLGHLVAVGRLRRIKKGRKVKYVPV